jgi:hypothetical protein
MRLSFGSLITHHSGQRLNHTTDSVASFRSLYVSNCSLEIEWTTSDSGQTVQQGESYTLTVTAHDTGGNDTSDSISDTSPSVTINSATHDPDSRGGRRHSIEVTFSGTDPDNQFSRYNVTVYDSSSRDYRVGSSQNSYTGGQRTIAIEDNEQGNNQGDDPYYVVVELKTNANNPAVAEATTTTTVE